MSAVSYTLKRDIVYKTLPDKTKLKLNLFRPHGGIKAILIFAHGGGFIKGSKNGLAAQHFADKLCAEGVVVASVGYRLKTELSKFPEDKQKLIEKSQARSIRVGLPINPDFCGPRFHAALEDLSDAVTFLRQKHKPSTPLTALGISAGGIAAMSLAFPPRGWENLNRPDAVIGLCAAMVQPWRLAPDGVPSLMLNGPVDRIIAPKCAQIISRRAARAKAPLDVVITDTRGHNTQVNLFLNGDDATGLPWLDRARRMMQLIP
jgi:pimeloyl-ACP methyl ester carboxylesterase